MNVLHKQDGFFTEQLDSSDNDLFNAIRSELGRQREEIELIASENIVSRAGFGGSRFRDDKQVC